MIDAINQAPQQTKRAFGIVKLQARQVVVLIFSLQRACLRDMSALDQWSELSVQLRQLLRQKLALETDDQLIAHIATAVVAMIKAKDACDGIVGTGGEFIKAWILGADPALRQQIFHDTIFPLAPISSRLAVGVRAFNKDNGNNGALARLNKRENLKNFVHGSKAAGENRDRVGVADKHKLAREKVFK